MPTLSWQDIYGSGATTSAQPQSQGATATAPSSTGSGGSAGSLAAGSVGWWLALVAGLVVVRVIYELKGRED